MDLENCKRAAPIVSGILLVIITIMANAYWVEGVRWADKADAAKIRGDTQDFDRCNRHMKCAKIIFQVVAVLMLATLVATVPPILFPKMFLVGLIINLVCTVFIGIFCIVYATGCFLIPLR